jgi:hypothetical protein
MDARVTAYEVNTGTLNQAGLAPVVPDHDGRDCRGYRQYDTTNNVFTATHLAVLLSN